MLPLSRTFFAPSPMVMIISITMPVNTYSDRPDRGLNDVSENRHHDEEQQNRGGNGSRTDLVLRKDTEDHSDDTAGQRCNH